MKNRQLTKDDFLYTPGMTLFGACEGQVFERPTEAGSPHPDYAQVSGLDIPFVHISSHYAKREAAQKEANLFAGLSQRVVWGKMAA
jgi:hypothetical protein